MLLREHCTCSCSSVGWLVGWLFFFYITKQTGNSAQYYDGDVLFCSNWPLKLKAKRTGTSCTCRPSASFLKLIFTPPCMLWTRLQTTAIPVSARTAHLLRNVHVVLLEGKMHGVFVWTGHCRGGWRASDHQKIACRLALADSDVSCL